MTEGELEDAVCGGITDDLLKRQGHDRHEQPARSELYMAIAHWRAKFHHTKIVHDPLCWIHTVLPRCTCEDGKKKL